MVDVQVISTTTVQAVKHKDFTRIELTPWDLQLLQLGYVQKGLLFKKPSHFQETKIISKLQSSLSSTLEIFTPLAGRLGKDIHRDGSVSYYIDCNNVGAEFVSATADALSMADILEPTYIPRVVHSFFQLNGVLNYEGTSRPLLAVQVTELTDGIFIGCSINHVIVDGTSFWHFFNTWSKLCQGSDGIANPPGFKRWFPEGVECPIRISLPLETKLQDDGSCLPLHLTERIFHFKKESIAKLKAKANSEMGTNGISSLQALLAHLWRSVVRSQNIDPNDNVYYTLLVGTRARLKSVLPEQYFGNAVQGAAVIMKAGELVEHGLGNAALQINNIVALHTEERLTSFYRTWQDNPRLFCLQSLKKNSLATSSSPQFNVYGNDFGWGRPIAVRSGIGNKQMGKITLFPGAEEGNVIIEVCLEIKLVEGIGNDPEFMEAVST